MIRCLHCEEIVHDPCAAMWSDTEELAYFCTQACRHVYMCNTDRDMELCHDEVFEDGCILMGELE